MEKTIIIYGSQYGSTKRYAKQLAKITSIEDVSYTEVRDLAGYNRIIYLGALYAGGVLGLKKTVGKLSHRQGLVVVTVGLADPTDDTNIATIRRNIKTQIPTEYYDESRTFHLRGAIDYSRLGLKHRMMMSLLHSKVAKLPENQQNAETRALLATYGKQVDFVDLGSLEPIIKTLNLVHY